MSRCAVHRTLADNAGNPATDRMSFSLDEDVLQLGHGIMASQLLRSLAECEERPLYFISSMYFRIPMRIFGVRLHPIAPDSGRKSLSVNILACTFAVTQDTTQDAKPISVQEVLLGGTLSPNGNSV